VSSTVAPEELLRRSRLQVAFGCWLLCALYRKASRSRDAVTQELRGCVCGRIGVDVGGRRRQVSAAFELLTRIMRACRTPRARTDEQRVDREEGDRIAPDPRSSLLLKPNLGESATASSRNRTACSTIASNWSTNTPARRTWANENAQTATPRIAVAGRFHTVVEQPLSRMNAYRQPDSDLVLGCPSRALTKSAISPSEYQDQHRGGDD
jgi:hypothetical protein